MPGTVDGRDASFFIEKWYRHLIGQDDINPQGGIDIAVWLQKIWGYYTFGAGRDLLYDGRSDEFWASMILATNPTLIPPTPPVISAGTFSGTPPNLIVSVSDAEAIAFAVGTLTANKSVTWTIPLGNSAGKFAIDSGTGAITLAATLNWWNLNFLTGGSTYALTIRATDSGGLYDEVTLTVTVTSPYENGIQFLKLNETAGTDALDYSTVNPFAGTRDGVYSGVALNQITNPGGITAPLSDGINDFVNLYSAALNTAFNGAKGTLSLLFKPFDSGFYAGTTLRYAVAIFNTTFASGVFIRKDATANTLRFGYWAGGTQENMDVVYSDTGWSYLAITWDKAVANAAIAYINGVQVATSGTLGTWSGNLLSTNCTICAIDTGGGSPSKIYPSYLRIHTEALPAAHIAKLAAEFAV